MNLTDGPMVKPDPSELARMEHRIQTAMSYELVRAMHRSGAHVRHKSSEHTLCHQRIARDAKTNDAIPPFQRLDRSCKVCAEEMEDILA